MSVFGNLILWVVRESVREVTKMKGDHLILYWDQISQIDLELAMVHDFLYGDRSNFFESEKVYKHSRLLTGMLDSKMTRLGQYCPEFGELWGRKRMQETWLMLLRFDLE